MNNPLRTVVAARDEALRRPVHDARTAAILGIALGCCFLICFLTGLYSHLQQHPVGWLPIPPRPASLYRVTQGLHVATGLAAIPLLLAKLWAAMPKLFEWPPVRTLAHLLERLSLALLVGGSLFVLFTGVFNIQNWYPWGFSFVASHYYASFIFLAALALHVVSKAPIALRSFRQRGVVRPLRDDLASTKPEPPAEGTTAPVAPGPATISRRGLLATIGAGSVGLGVMAAAQSVGGPLRPLGLLAPRGRVAGDGPNDFPVNRTAAAAGIDAGMSGPGWRLRVEGPRPVELSRVQLLELAQQTETLPIACVEGWSTTQDWTGVRLTDLARLAGVDGAAEATVESLQTGGSFRTATLSAGQAGDERTLLALLVNGVDLSPDHGYPARIIAPAIPGVHCTKWVASISFRAV